MSSAAAGWKIALTAPSAAAAAVLADALERFAEAVSSFEIDPGGAWSLEGYSEQAPDQVALRVAVALAAASVDRPPPEVTVVPLPATDWVAENQRSFRPIRVGRYFVHPSHFDGPVPASLIGLEVDAAAAFGTGEHATTQGCLLAFDRLARRRRIHRGLDLGCGTAILAIAMAHTWHTPVVAVDIDPQSVQVARTNVQTNRAGPWVRIAVSDGLNGDPVRRQQPYDLIAANILARPLRLMAGDLARALAPGGYAVLSGLLRHQERAVAGAYRAFGLMPFRRLEIGNWPTLVMRRP